MKKFISYSEYLTWKNYRERYYDTYIKGIKNEPNEAMILGSVIHKALEEPKYEWIRELKKNNLGNKIKIVRKLLDKAESKKVGKPEFTLIAKKDDLKIFSIFDGFDKKERILNEWKTSDNEKWSQKQLDIHLQLSFYAWVYYLTYHQFFTEIRLHFLNTKKGTIKTYKTVRSITDIKAIEKDVLKIVREIKDNGLWEKRLSKDDKCKENNLKLNI